ncbi:cupin domain-containing protein [Lachnospiraceae bacterium 38-10]
MASIQDLGKFPAPGPESRDKRIFYKLTDDTGIKMISGRKTPALLSVWASNDVVSFGTIKLLSGGAGPQQTEYDKHPGDVVFYVLEGTMTFYCPERKETFDVAQGDFMFIPEGDTYKIINYTGKTIRAVFMAAPQL